MPSAATWIDQEATTHSELRQLEKDKEYMWNLKINTNKLILQNRNRGSHCGSAVTNLTGIHEDAGWIPGLAQCV